MAVNWKNGRIDSGKLRHRIDIVTVSPTQDSTGGINFSDAVVFASVWATVKAVGGDESFSGQSETSVVSHQIVIRYLVGITSAMQVRFDGRHFQVKDVLNPDGRNKMLCLQSVEINDSRQQIA